MTIGKERDSAFHLGRVAEHVPSMLAYWDLDLRCRYANRAYQTWFGISPERLIGMAIQDLLGASLFALNEPHIRAALAGQAQTFERTIVGPDGVPRDSLASYRPDVIEGKVAGLVVCVTEITPIKRVEARLQGLVNSLEAEVHRRRTAEESLADIQQNLAVTLASIDAGFMATDRQGLVTRMNTVSERLTGWQQHEALGHSYWEVLVREDRPTQLTATNPVELMVAQGVTVDTPHHVTVVARSGVRTPVEIKAALTHAGDGTVKGLAMVLRDATQRLQAEVEANRLAAIVESSHDPIVGKTLDGRITSWNAAAQALFGYTAEEIIGRQVQVLIPADRQDEEMRILANLARGERVPEFETVRRTRDGRPIEVSVTISPIRDAHGRIAGASKIVRDITHRKQAEVVRLKAERLEAENRQIQLANRIKSQFLANMSHELRTPLSAVIGFADLLYSGAVPPESSKHHTFLGHIASSGRHLLQLINDVLDLSKVESGKFEFFPEPLNLPMLVAEVVEMLQGAAGRKRIGLTMDIAPELDHLVLDPARLRQALYNYVSNAIKFTAQHGSVAIIARAEGPLHFRLEVHDTGIGIAAQHLPRLFSEFEQVDASHSRQQQGTGLGLALTRRLVQAQGGSVGVASEPGRGSVFHLVLNRVHGTDLAGMPAAARPQAPRHQLLVIEGDPRVQTALLAGLDTAGFEVRSASTGNEALRQAQSTEFQALTLGFVLPDLAGLSLLASLRSNGASRSAPVVGLTVPVGDGAAASFAIADILSKPIFAAQLAAAVGRVGKPGSGRTRIMVIDDEPDALALMGSTLEGLGVQAICLQDGREALKALDQHRPQALILDLMMPGFDGFAVLDALRRMPAWRDLPVFIWTAMLLSDDEYARLAGSARAVLSKGGGELAALLESLRRWRPAASHWPVGG